MLKQRLQQKLLQKLSPQQIQMIKLLEIPTMQLEQRIKKELEENPVLEEGQQEEDDVQETPEASENGEENNEKDEFSLHKKPLRRRGSLKFRHLESSTFFQNDLHLQPDHQ